MRKDRHRSDDSRLRLPTTGLRSRRSFLAAAAAGAAASTRLPAASSPRAGPRGPTAAPAAEDHPRVIDCHNHPDWLGHDADRIVANMDEQGIDRAWLLSWEAPGREIARGYDRSLDPLAGSGISFRSVVRACQRHPDRFVAGYAPDPRDPRSRDRLRAAVEIHRVRVFGELKIRATYDNPDLISMFRLCGELRLPVTFHLDIVLPPGRPQEGWQYWYGGTLDAVERALDECPETIFLGHAPGFWRYVSGDADTDPAAYPKGTPVAPGGRLLELLDRHPNLHCDLSAGSGLTAISRDPAFGRKFLLRYQDRVLFGRDQFSRDLYRFLTSLELPPAVLAKILGGNALRLVPLAKRRARPGGV